MESNKLLMNDGHESVSCQLSFRNHFQHSLLWPIAMAICTINPLDIMVGGGAEYKMRCTEKRLRMPCSGGTGAKGMPPVSLLIE